MWCVRPAYVCAHKSLGFRRHCRCCRTLSITEEEKKTTTLAIICLPLCMYCLRSYYYILVFSVALVCVDSPSTQRFRIFIHLYIRLISCLLDFVWFRDSCSLTVNRVKFNLFPFVFVEHFQNRSTFVCDFVQRFWTVRNCAVNFVCCESNRNEFKSSLEMRTSL